MKSYTYKLRPYLFAIAVSSLAACNKLDETPKGVLTTSNFYKTQNDAVAAVTSVYSTLSTDVNNDFPIYGRNLNLLTENTSDNQVYSPSNTNPDVRALGTATYVSTNDRVRKLWAQLYWGVNKANIAVDKIAEIADAQFTDPTKSKANLIREAKFIRALHYFNLVRLYGEVPLVLHDITTLDLDKLKYDRAPKDSVYKQIIDDLTDATNLPATYTATNVGRATSGAAWALLGKVYVTRQEWAKAKTALEKVITAGTGFAAATGNYGYDLFANFRDAFQPATKNGKEHIFSAQFNGTAGGFVSNQILSSFTWSNTAYTADIPADGVVKIFEVADQRRTVSFYDSLFNNSTNAWVKWPYSNFLKFVDQSPGFTNALAGKQGGNSTVNFPVIRYADILLLYAETLNELNGSPTADAYLAINQVRGRAYKSYTSSGNYTDKSRDLAGLSYQDFQDTIFVERRREFIQEAQRWFDLVRRGINARTGNPYIFDALSTNPAKTGVKIGNKNRFLLLPIPQVELDLYSGTNPTFKQNPGWD